MSFMKYKKGFTLVEALIALVVVSTIFALTISVNRSVVNNSNMAIKKASQTLNDVVQSLLDDMNYYSGDDAFGDLREIRLADGQPVSGERKFQDLFKNMIKLNERHKEGEILLCPILISQSEIQNDGACFMSEDGIVWGIPETDFRTKNIVKLSRRGYETAYVPITIYPNCKFGEADTNGVSRCTKDINHETYFDDEAVVFAIRRDGDIRVYSRYDCTNNEHKGRLQCRTAEIISDESF